MICHLSPLQQEQVSMHLIPVFLHLKYCWKTEMVCNFILWSRMNLVLPGLCSVKTGTLGFRQKYPHHYILPAIVDLHICYHRKDIKVRIWLAKWISFLVFAWQLCTQKCQQQGTLFGAVTFATAFIENLPLLLDNFVLLWRYWRHAKLFKAAKVSSFNMDV